MTTASPPVCNNKQTKFKVVWQLKLSYKTTDNIRQQAIRPWLTNTVLLAPYTVTYTVKNIHISMEPVPHAFASINRRNNEVQTHTAMWASASLFCPFTHTNVCGTGSDQIWKTCHKISVDIRILLQCTVQVVSGLMLITGFQRQ